MMIMNEVAEAERILRENDIGDKPYNTASLLVRYFYYHDELKGQALRDRIDEFMSENYQGYSSIKWNQTIRKLIDKAENYPLVCIDNIPVTKKELETIDNSGNIRMRRLAFTLLVLAKFGNMRNENNNSWVSVQHKDLFAMADIRTTVECQALLLNDLKEAGLITFSSRVDNTSIHVEYISDDPDIVLNVTTLNCIGKIYSQYTMPKKFSNCKDCGTPFRRKGSHHFYCNSCSAIRRYERSLHKRYQK